MVYVTTMQRPIYRQMTLEELLFQDFSAPVIINDNTANTKTIRIPFPGKRLMKALDIDALIQTLRSYNQSTDSLREKRREDLYRSFHIPKKSGGLRRIDAPCPELMDALRKLKKIFEEDFHALYHTSAFAYVRKRCAVDAVKRHQHNESRWFAKLDLHNFFGSTTLDFVMSMLSIIFPFSEVIRNPSGKEELERAVELAFLNGGLPQGTPFSPLITNIMMIPIDFRLCNAFLDFPVKRQEEEADHAQRFIYTRYADDFIISSRYDFDIRQIEAFIVDTLREFCAPFSVNAAKTRYGSSAGRNWNLGVMLNKDNQITVGAKRKRQFMSMLHNYIVDKQNAVQWSLNDIQVMKGLHSYYCSVEEKTINALVAHINAKMGVDVMRMIKDDLKQCV